MAPEETFMEKSIMDGNALSPENLDEKMNAVVLAARRYAAVLPGLRKAMEPCAMTILNRLALEDMFDVALPCRYTLRRTYAENDLGGEEVEVGVSLNKSEYQSNIARFSITDAGLDLVSADDLVEFSMDLQTGLLDDIVASLTQRAEQMTRLTTDMQG